MPKFKHIASKFAVLLHALIFVFVLYFSYTHYHDSKQKVIKTIENRLALEAKIKKSSLQKQFTTTESELLFLAQTGTLKLGLDTLKTAWAELGEQASSTLIQAYITQNTLADKSTLLNAETNSTYDILHEAIHSYLHELQQNSHYKDIFLLDMDGNILYTVQKSKAFASTIQKQSSPLKEVFNTLLKQDQLIAFKSNEHKQSFIATLVKDELKEPIGVLILSLNPILTHQEFLITPSTQEACHDSIEQNSSHFLASSCLSYQDSYWNVQASTQSAPLFAPIKEEFYTLFGVLALLAFLALALSYLILEKLLERKDEDD